ncbi:PREDICTED: transcription factor HES-4-A-like [Gavialis gangeticus]|uniref:transcription factor HES-4-A-like n=1 Tax=Gavialis gangeticus TaxID=94835 RepID=UPI00092EE937|nr:PREDICTED: transcription factor HES-4-A-like [Gavialis gangeticus]
MFILYSPFLYAACNDFLTSPLPRLIFPQSIKPLVEKRRRARINASLEQLRRLLQQNPEKQDARALSRLEKAEILEMTVQQLQRLKKPDIAASKDGQDFAAGYCHCLSAVSNFLSSVGSSLNQNIRSQILRQLEDASKVRSTVAPDQSPKIWQPQEANLPSTKPHLRQSSAFLRVTAPALLPPGTTMTLPALETQSRPRGQMSQSPALGSQLPLPPSLSRTLTNAPATPQMWRPW